MSQQLVGGQVFYGHWTNWDHKAIVGSTITLSQRSGTLLIAFLAIFVAAAGGAFWRIVAFALHQWRASTNAEDGLYHQQQVQLRNTSSPGTFAWHLAQMAYYWRKSMRGSFWRSMPLVLTAILVFVAFAVAGIFSSEVTKAAGNQILIASNDCGNWTANGTASITASFVALHKSLNDTLRASSYARDCYGTNSTAPACNQYVSQQIHYNTENASCPFAKEMCLRSSKSDPEKVFSYSMDTGLVDSHHDLGINMPPQERIQFRRKTTCAPLADKGYVFSLNYTVANASNMLAIDGPGGIGRPGDTFDFYYYGPYYNHGNPVNFTYYYNEHASTTGYGYELTSLSYDDGLDFNVWTPIDELMRHDGDVTVMFLAANSLLYLDEVLDPWFQATASENTILQNGVGDTYYSSDYYTSPLGCVDQFQFCNPITTDCTNLTSYYHAVYESWNLNMTPTQLVTIARMSLDLGFETMDGAVGGRGPNALRAQESISGIYSGPLPRNQWVVEVESWFQTGLAKLQQYTVQYAAGVPNAGPGFVVQRPNDTVTHNLCRNQKVSATGHDATSFSTLGIGIIIAVGGLLVLVNLSLDTIVGYLQSHGGRRTYQRDQWLYDDKLQLQRLAYEAVGLGTWTEGSGGKVPTTIHGETFKAFTSDDDAKRSPSYFADHRSSHSVGKEGTAYTSEDVELQHEHRKNQSDGPDDEYGLVSQHGGYERLEVGDARPRPRSEILSGLQDEIASIMSRHSRAATRSWN